MKQTLENTLNAYSTATSFSIGARPGIIVENATDKWVFKIVGNMATLVKHQGPNDPINDIRNSLEPEDFK